MYICLQDRSGLCGRGDTIDEAYRNYQDHGGRGGHAKTIIVEAP